MTERPCILFLCTGNSARSILAEAIANQQFGEHIRACSAGASPTGVVHPLAMQTLEAHGLSTEGLSSKPVDDVPGESFDLVITLCDAARDAPCPVLVGNPTAVHWPVPDPPKAKEPGTMFEAAFETLQEAIGLLVHGPSPTLSTRAAEAGRGVAQRFSARMI